MPNAQQNTQVWNATLGFRVQGATKTVVTGATTIFTVSAGRIQVGLLYGLVTTILSGGATALKLVATPTTGSANDMCTTLTVTADEAGAMFVLPLAVSSALIGAAAAGVSGSVSGAGNGGQIVAPGTIGTSFTGTPAGSILWTLFYIPLDTTSTVVAN